MNACVSCGHETSDDARFCSQCGLPIAATISGRDLLDHNDEKDDWLLSSSVARTPQRSGAVGRIVATFAVVVLAVTVYLLLRTPTESVDDIADALRTPTTASSTTTATTLIEAQQDAPEENADADPAVVDVTGLDTLSDHYVIVAGLGRFHRIDMSTGEVVEFPAPGQIIGYYDGDLIALVESKGLAAIPVADPNAAETTIELPQGEQSDLTSAFMSDRGTVDIDFYTFPNNGPPQRQSIHVDLVRAAISVDTTDFGGLSQFGLAAIPGGGIYELTADGYRYLVDGQISAVGARYMVVDDCESPDDCRSFWFDRRSRTEVDRPLPYRQPFFGAVLDDGGRILRLLNVPGETALTYFDVALGRFLPEEFAAGDGSDGSFVLKESVSPDGRYLVTVSGSRTLLIYELDGDELHEIPFNFGTGRLKTLVIPKEP